MVLLSLSISSNIIFNRSCCHFRTTNNIKSYKLYYDCISKVTLSSSYSTTIVTPAITKIPRIDTMYYYQEDANSSYNKDMFPFCRKQIIKHENENVLYELLLPFYNKQLPVIIRNSAKDYPAIIHNKWNQLSYWKDIVEKQKQDTHFVDLELGPYNSSNGNNNNNNNNTEVTIKDVPFEQYITYLELYDQEQKEIQQKEQEQEHNEQMEQHEQNQNKQPLLYLAQNDLPSFLYDDIIIPKFLSQQQKRNEDSSDDDENDNISKQLLKHKLYSVMIWMGPTGCWTPCHYDPLDNLLIQMVGTKRIVLFDKCIQPEHIYAGNNNAGKNNNHHRQSKNQQQYNTTTIVKEIGNHCVFEINNRNHYDRLIVEYPLLHNIIPSHIQVGTIYPGDILYIPSKWWHEVTSIPNDSIVDKENDLSFNVSVNMWWR